MSSVNVVWKGNCRSAEARVRLQQHVEQLARLNERYLRPKDRPFLTVVGEGHVMPRANIEIVDEVREGQILVSADISAHPEILITRAREAGLHVREMDDGKQCIVLDKVDLRGIDFRLFDPRGLYPDEDRMSFVFIECPEHHFLDGRLVKVAKDGDVTLLSCPSLKLKSYLEDWTDCLFSWMRFFLMGDLWWSRHEELQGYHDYRDVFEAVQTAQGSAAA